MVWQPEVDELRRRHAMAEEMASSGTETRL